LARRSSPQKRPPPKATKSFEENEFRSKHDRTPNLAKIGEDTDKPKGASLAALSRSMKPQPESSINTINCSRSVQLQPSTDGSAKSKNVKAENALPGRQQKRPQPQSLQSLGDELPRSFHQKRAPPKSTKSLDEKGLSCLISRSADENNWKY
jgi:hypothetical protein